MPKTELLHKYKATCTECEHVYYIYLYTDQEPVDIFSHCPVCPWNMYPEIDPTIIDTITHAELP